MLRLCIALAVFAFPVLAAAQRPEESPALPPDTAEQRQAPIDGARPSQDGAQLPRIPAPDERAAMVSDGFTVEIVAANLTYPTSIEFDDQGGIYIAEAGYAYGDDAAPARISRIGTSGRRETVADQLNGPINDILWHEGRLFISHRGKISVLEGDRVRDLVTGLPSAGDHHNNSLAAGPDGLIYFGQGTATNSGVVGLDNFLGGWLQKHPQTHDIPAFDIQLREQVFETPDPISLLTQKDVAMAETSAFQPFGKSGSSVRGAIKANGTILRMDPQGNNLEVFAWGLRNPFGLGFTPDGQLLVTDAGYDERGSRPIANAPDCLWAVREGGWYGFPDFVAGKPVTDAEFRSQRGPAPEFLLAEHPRVEKPLATLPPHTSGTKFDLSRGGAFGRNQCYMALAGDMTPATGEPGSHPGYGVARLDMETLEVVPFFRARRDRLGPEGFEYVATAGPKRPVDVKFSPDGRSLWVVDFGAMAVVPTAVGPAPRPFPGSGVVWRISSGSRAAAPRRRQVRRYPVENPAEGLMQPPWYSVRSSWSPPFGCQPF